MQKKQNWTKSFSMAINLSTSIAAAIALGYLGGQWLDGRFNTGMLFSIIGFLLGIGTAGKMFWDRLNAENREDSMPKNK